MFGFTARHVCFIPFKIFKILLVQYNIIGQYNSRSNVQIVKIFIFNYVSFKFSCFIVIK